MKEEKILDQLKIIKNVCSRVPRYKSPETACLAEWYLEQIKTRDITRDMQIQAEIAWFIEDTIKRHIPEHFLW